MQAGLEPSVSKGERAGWCPQGVRRTSRWCLVPGKRTGVAFACQKELRIPLKLQVNERRPTSSRRVWVHQLGSTTAGTRCMWFAAVPPMLNTESGAQWPPPTPRKKTKNSVLSHKTSPPRLRDLALSVPSPFTSQPQFAFLSCCCSWALGAPGNI